MDEPVTSGRAHGRSEAALLGTHLHALPLEAVYCPAMRRSVETARIALGDSILMFTDARLNELNYGDLSGAPRAQVEAVQEQHISAPFPHGESYNQRLEMMRSSLAEKKQRYPSGTILIIIIGHRSTHYCLDVLLNRRRFQQAMAEPFRRQTYWPYEN